MNNVSAVLITRDATYPKEIKLEGFGEVIIRTESPNVFTRYLEAEKAKHDIIYFQDDDAIIDYKTLWEQYDGRLTVGITENHHKAYRASGVTLVGWGAFFPKTMLKVFTKYIDEYGVDEHLLREADRIFTYFNKPFNQVIMSHEDFKPQVGRMWNEKLHWTSMAEAIEKCRLLEIK